MNLLWNIIDFRMFVTKLKYPVFCLFPSTHYASLVSALLKVCRYKQKASLRTTETRLDCVATSDH